jgi:hypothetical protein
MSRPLPSAERQIVRDIAWICHDPDDVDVAPRQQARGILTGCYIFAWNCDQQCNGHSAISRRRYRGAITAG